MLFWKQEKLNLDTRWCCLTGMRATGQRSDRQALRASGRQPNTRPAPAASPLPSVALTPTSRELWLLCLQPELCTLPPSPQVMVRGSSPAITCTGPCQSGVCLSRSVQAAAVGVGTPEDGRMEGLASPRGNTHQLLLQPPAASARSRQGQPAGHTSRQSD